jgi:hypothetical protein
METKICPYDHKTFEPDHGNRVYCNDDCYDRYKKKKQKENNLLIKKFRKGFIGNYRVFQELLPEPGSTNTPIFNLLKSGFDQDAYYGTVIDKKGILWHKVNEYLFNISKVEEQPILFIFKQ